MLKFQLDNLDGLDASISPLYKEITVDGAKKFQLDLEGYEDPGALLRAKNHEKTQRQQAETKVRELTDQLNALQTRMDELDNQKDDKHRKNGNVAELDASWQAKMDRLKAEHQTVVEGLNKQISTLLVDNVADTMAAELSDSPELLADIIRKRLTVEDGKTRVLDSEGKLSATTVDELRDELRANKKYAAVIRGSQGSGGGSGGGGKGGGAPKKFSEMSEQERTELFKTNPAEFNRLAAENKAAQK